MLEYDSGYFRELTQWLELNQVVTSSLDPLRGGVAYVDAVGIDYATNFDFLELSDDELEELVVSGYIISNNILVVTLPTLMQCFVGLCSICNLTEDAHKRRKEVKGHEEQCRIGKIQ
jgi:hypothetical protein